MKFRILAGKHIDDGPNGKQIVYGAPNPRGEMPPGGNIIDSAIDLAARFNQPDAVKFERLPDAPAPAPQGQPAVKK